MGDKIRSIITKNDFIIKFNDDTKMYKAVLMFHVKQPVKDFPDVLANFGHMRVFKGDGKTIKIAMNNCMKELEFALQQIKFS